MLRLTTEAAEHLIRVRRERHLETTAMPRFIRRDGRLKLTFANEPASGDRVIADRRISALVANSASDLLDAATIDVKSADGTTRLTVHRNRNGQTRQSRAKSTTGTTAKSATTN
jgi:Fe-S cluster assembly iron-binding protein IscA